MPSTPEQIEPLPEEFTSEEEAGEFWDAHSIADYADLLEPADVDVRITKRHFEIEVDEESFRALRQSANRQHRPVKEVASETIKRHLVRN